jgi:hypothetical protein
LQFNNNDDDDDDDDKCTMIDVAIPADRNVVQKEV